ncbi:MAG: hypothetical protein RL435_163, partial [Actinomycetota bacterium]
GPKIRLGKFVEGTHELAQGSNFVITMDEIIGNNLRASTTYKGLARDCTAGDILLIDDGKVRLQVSKIESNDIHTVVRTGGLISNNKGINAPGSSLSVPALSEKDVADLEWALGVGVDIIALSFVRTADDIRGVHAVMDRFNVRIPVIAKIEKPQAVSNLDEIVGAFDGLMVARGDLGVELPIEEVPLVQKKCIIAARENAKPVIVATQMLESMISLPTPTRAEATDCANAILDGADALMLSGGDQCWQVSNRSSCNDVAHHRKNRRGGVGSSCSVTPYAAQQVRCNHQGCGRGRCGCWRTVSRCIYAKWRFSATNGEITL